MSSSAILSCGTILLAFLVLGCSPDDVHAASPEETTASKAEALRADGLQDVDRWMVHLGFEGEVPSQGALDYLHEIHASRRFPDGSQLPSAVDRTVLSLASAMALDLSGSKTD